MFFYVCVYQQDFIRNVRLLLAAVSINGLNPTQPEKPGYAVCWILAQPETRAGIPKHPALNMQNMTL